MEFVFRGGIISVSGVPMPEGFPQLIEDFADSVVTDADQCEPRECGKALVCFTCESCPEHCSNEGGARCVLRKSRKRK
jgi:hypothetical protein